ncbi:MAG: hypothetical protein EBT03_12660, partial [Betaproteobacteria bacterium]|nr:hypothetical protein [Betaproteobacteria bacterium]
KWSELSTELGLQSGKTRPASREILEEQVIAASKGLSAGDSLVLYVTDHGSAPDDDAKTREVTQELVTQEIKSKYPNFETLEGEEQGRIRTELYDRIFREQRVRHRNANPLSAGIILWGSKLTGESLVEVLKKVPEGVKIKLVGVQCFSGMLNEVASRLPGACASASTDYRTENKSTKEKSYFSDGFTDGITQAGILPTLEAGHRAGVAADQINEGRAQISSAYFAERVVNRAGVSEELAYERIKSGMDRTLAVRTLALFTMIEEGAIEGSTESELRKLLAPPSADVVPASECGSPGAESGFAIIESLNAKLKSLFAGDTRLEDPEDAAVRAALSGLKSKWPELTSLVKYYRERRADLIAEWEKVTAAGDPDVGGPPTPRAVYTKKFEELRTGFERQILKTGILPYYRDLKDAMVLQQFKSVATAEEKAKYESLRRCETEP